MLDEASPEQQRPPWTPTAGAAVLVDGERQAVVIRLTEGVSWYRGPDARKPKTMTNLQRLTGEPLAYVKFRTACGACGWSEQCAMTGYPAEACPYSRPSGIQTGNVAVERLTPRPNPVRVDA